MTHSVEHLFLINAKRDEVYKAISTHDGLSNWRTKDVKGDTDMNGVIKFRFAENGGPDMKVKELKTAEL